MNIIFQVLLGVGFGAVIGIVFSYFMSLFLGS